MRALRLTGVIALTAVALTGACSKQVARTPGKAAPVTETISPTAAPSAAATASPVSSASPSDTGPATAPKTIEVTKTVKPAKTDRYPDDPCPVSAKILYRVLRKDKDRYSAGGEPTGLTKPPCYHGYAFPSGVYKPGADQDVTSFLFGYDVPAQSWILLSLGTGGVCDGYVPPDVIEHICVH